MKTKLMPIRFGNPFPRLSEAEMRAASEDVTLVNAVRHGVRILTTDTDFDQFAKHLPIELHAVRGRKVPRSMLQPADTRQLMPKAVPCLPVSTPGG